MPLFKLFASLALFPCVFAQLRPTPDAIPIPPDRGSAAVWQSLKKLHTRASLILITAHPDDEDGGMLSWASRGKGARVTLLTLNRGEGGANVMSPDFFDALGLVRTEELLAAGRYYGVDQYWTRMIDYGFSKTLAESLGKWGHDNVLRDVVRVVRMTRPLVIASVFVGGPSDGHGNHQAAGLMAKEVYEAAGDPTRFPEQIRQGLEPWQPLKDYAHVPFFGPAKEQFGANVEIPEGDYDPMLGMTYRQIASEGLGHQRSQNGGTEIPAPGRLDSSYHRFASRVAAQQHENSFFDGIDVSLEGIALLAGTGNVQSLREALRAINSDVERAISTFDARHPGAIAPLLADGLNKTARLIAAVQAGNLPARGKYGVLFELRVKERQFNDALAQSLGVSIRANVAPDRPVSALRQLFEGDPDTFRVAIPGQRFRVNVHTAAEASSGVTLYRVELKNTDGTAWRIQGSSSRRDLGDGEFFDTGFEVGVSADASLTQPYFSRSGIELPFYTIGDPRYENLPLAPYPLEAWAEFSYSGARFRVGQVVQTAAHVTGYGTVFEPLAVAPAISVALSSHAAIAPLDSTSFPLSAVIHSNVKGPANGAVSLDLPPGWTSEPRSAAFSTVRDGEEQIVQFRVRPAHLAEREYKITAAARYHGADYREGYHVTGYPGLRPYFLYSPAACRVAAVDVKTAPGLKVGYIMGTGDDVPAAIGQLGIKPFLLASSDLAAGDLAGFDVILIGIRGYAARDDLKTYNARLLDYVKNGGIVIVQYNTPEFDHNYGPYPYSMTGDPEEVTDEASKIEILDPSNPVFTWPNAITQKDFDGWVEERGSKFMKSWDSRYQALLSTEDPSQAPQKGGLLYARYGKGVWIYNAYAFYRQLPEGVPGAYRIFANMLSLAKNPSLVR